TAPIVCPECRGRGVITESQGLFGLSHTCPRCHGSGTVIEKPCPRCHGTGRERRTKRYKVKIPAGVKNGTQIRLKGKGEPGYGGGPPGDLIVVTRVADSPLYRRRGSGPRGGGRGPLRGAAARRGGGARRGTAGRSDRRNACGGFAALQAARLGPRGRGPGHVRRRGSRREGRGADPRRAGLARGSRRVR